jgi:type VI protein secretion system component Hcp
MMAKRFRVTVLVLGFAGFLGLRDASAQTKAFLFIDGIPGDSVDSGHPNWIDVLSLNQSFEPGGLACDLTLTKGLDQASPLLWAAAALGDPFPDMRIESWRQGFDRRRLYELALATVQFKRVSTIDNAQAYAEMVALQAKSLTLSFFPVDATGRPLPPVVRTIACGP